MPSLIIASCVAVICAILAFYLFQRTLITTHLEKFIESQPEYVFRLISNPNILPDLHYSSEKVTVINITETDDGMIHREYVIASRILHAGLQNIECYSVADPNSLKLTIHTSLLNGFFQGFINYSFPGATRKGKDGTLLTENAHIYVPWILRNFANKTTIQKHQEIFENIKLLAERDQDVT